MWVGLHQGSGPCPLHFIIVLEALFSEFRKAGCPWELLFADDLMIRSESMEEMLIKVRTEKSEWRRRACGEVQPGENKDSGVWN